MFIKSTIVRKLRALAFFVMLISFVSGCSEARDQSYNEHQTLKAQKLQPKSFALHRHRHHHHYSVSQSQPMGASVKIEDRVPFPLPVKPTNPPKDNQ